MEGSRLAVLRATCVAKNRIGSEKNIKNKMTKHTIKCSLLKFRFTFITQVRSSDGFV